MEIKFDYSLDSQGFFNDVARRDALEAAGTIWSNLLQDEFENIPVGAEFTITNPVTGATENIVLDTEIDDLVIFVGGTNSIDNAVGHTITEEEHLDSHFHFKGCCCHGCLDHASNLSQKVLGEDETNNNLIVLAKAQVDGGDLQGDLFQRRITRNFRDSGEVVTDFEPWVGTIAFNSTANWDFSLGATDPNRSDFISVALHEIAHILGIGVAPNFDSLVEGNQFQGVNSLAANNGQPIPLDETAGHVSEDFSNNQVLLDPTLNEGRTLPSDIDLALLADIGYEIAGFTQQGSVLKIATNSGETIFGTKFQDVIDGLGGNDSIQGNSGDDILNGGTGQDTIAGNDGNDLIFGDDDADTLLGVSGNDTIDGGTGNDFLLGDQGNDLLFGNDDDDELQGGEGDDSLQGGEGNDTLFGNGGQDLLIGNEGDDWLQGGSGNDSLQGSAGNDTIFGEAGADRIDGGFGNDVLLGGADADRFVFEPGSGEDAINDFAVGEDIIEVSPDYGFNNVEQLVAAITATGTSSNTDQLFSQISFSSGNVLTVFHDPGTSLSASSFAIGSSESATPLTMTSLVTTASGFVMQFNQSLNTEVLNLYDGADNSVDLPDLTLVNSAGDEVRGSLVWDENDLSLTFVQSGGVLASDRYTLTLTSNAEGFVSETGQILDGDSDGVAGGDFVTQFTVEPNQGRVLSIDDLSRGLGESIGVDPTGNSLAISLDNGSGVNQVEFTLNYDPSIFELDDIIVDPNLGGDWTLTTKDLTVPGRAIVNLQGTTALGADVDLVQLIAEVPDSAGYGVAGLLELDSVRLNQGNIGVIADTAVQQVASLGDASGDGNVSDFDAFLVSRVVVGFDSGFDAFPLIDPNVTADLNGDNAISAIDAFFITT